MSIITQTKSIKSKTIFLLYSIYFFFIMWLV